MAILQAILAALSRSMGKLFNTAFGWATVLLFGKVPENRQTLLSTMAMMSVAWLVFLIGVAFPSAGTFVLTFAPIPEWLEGWTRMIMLAAALIIPPIVGVIASFLIPKGDETSGKKTSLLSTVLRGYAFTLGLSLTLVVMVLVAPVMKVRDLWRGWSSSHVPVVVTSDDYSDVAAQISDVLGQRGIMTTPAQASRLVRWPTKLLTFFARDSISNFVADELKVFRGEELEVLLHPSDLVISGKEKRVARAHTALAVGLSFSKAHLTWTKESQELEDKLLEISQSIQRESSLYRLERMQKHIAALEGQLADGEFTYEEWEVLYREKLVIENRLLTRIAHVKEREVQGLRAEPHPPIKKPNIELSTMQKISSLAAIAGWNVIKKRFGRAKYTSERTRYS